MLHRGGGMLHRGGGMLHRGGGMLHRGGGIFVPSRATLALTCATRRPFVCHGLRPGVPCAACPSYPPGRADPRRPPRARRPARRPDERPPRAGEHRRVLAAEGLVAVPGGAGSPLVVDGPRSRADGARLPVLLGPSGLGHQRPLEGGPRDRAPVAPDEERRAPCAGRGGGRGPRGVVEVPQGPRSRMAHDGPGADPLDGLPVLYRAPGDGGEQPRRGLPGDGPRVAPDEERRAPARGRDPTEQPPHLVEVRARARVVCPARDAGEGARVPVLRGRARRARDLRRAPARSRTWTRRSSSTCTRGSWARRRRGWASWAGSPSAGGASRRSS